MARKDILEAFKDDIKVVDGPVSSELELAKIAGRDTTVPHLFANVDGKGRRVLTGLWGSRDRISCALGTRKEELPGLLLEAMKAPLRCSRASKAPFLRNSISKVDLRKIGVPKFFRRDGGPYLTAAMVVAEMDGVRNVSYHRMMLIGKDRMAMRIVPRHLYSMMKRKKGALKVAIVLTLNPAVMLSGAMSVSYGLDELTIASALHKKATGKALVLTKLPNGISVPTDSQIVMEARITDELVDEGPFVDITGTYDLVRKQNVVKVDRIWHVDGPTLYAVFPGGHDHYMMMGMPREPIIMESVRKAVPRVGCVRLTEGGCCWLHGVISIEQQKQGDGKNAIMAAFGAHPSMKHVVVVDTDIDVFEDRQVEWAIATRFQADRDTVLITGARGSTLDPSCGGGPTAKMGLDATRPVDDDDGFEQVIS